MEESHIQNNQSSPLQRNDYIWLSLLCWVYFGISLVIPRVFTTHETTHCINVREMFDSGSYLIPTYGGRVWLERPPVPHWLTGVGALLVGDIQDEFAMRFPSILFSWLTVLLVAHLAAQVFGRITGLLSGLVLATMREFASYAVAPEADIFLAGIVTIGGMLALKLLSRPAPQSTSFLGNRPTVYWLFYLVMGISHWTKGVFFGSMFIAWPILLWLIWTWDRRRFFALFWLPGILLFLGGAASWLLVASSNEPGVVDLWKNDYQGRYNTDYMKEPAWYYAVQQPWNIFPWTIALVVGLVTTFSQIRGTTVSPWRFVWLWAIVPPIFFSLFNGKHHHYMLSCLAPAAILGSQGLQRMFSWFQQQPRWFRHPALWSGILIPLGLGTILALAKKLPGPANLQTILLLAWVPLVLFATWFVSRPQPRVALVGLLMVITFIHIAAHYFRSKYLDNYAEDSRLIAEIRELVPPEEHVYVLDEEEPLNASWNLYYLGRNARQLQNITFLRSTEIDRPTIYLLARGYHQEQLAEYGVAEQLLQSKRTRKEITPADRKTLYRLTFHADLIRVVPPKITPMQSTGRAPGPFLK
ncbi:MAG: glycosyltransferase family 39 protein [Zavarzinella sp.]